VDGRGCHPEEVLHVPLGWRLAMDEGVEVDEGQVLPLEGSERRSFGVLYGLRHHSRSAE
jgi:hypothetical protein